MLKSFLLSAIFLLFPGPLFAAADLAISSGDLKFSAPKPLAGELIRIYATAHNIGQQDARLAVRFYVDGQPLGNDQPTTAVVGGASTVFMDWTPSEGYYKVAAELIDINPPDGNAENNRAEIKDFLVNLDSDHDGKHDTEDLDDDNDGITDGVEIINGTNPLKWDTDGDGVSDQEDIYPNDSSRFKLEIKPPAASAPSEPKPAPVAVVVNTPLPPPAKSAVAETVINPAESVAAPALVAANQPLTVVIAKSRTGWREWEFEALGAPAAANYLWDFGDKKLGEGQRVTHEFPGAGAYKITLSANSAGGNAGQTEETVVIGWWHWANLWVRIILGGLALGIMALALAIAFNLFPHYDGSQKK